MLWEEVVWLTGRFPLPVLFMYRMMVFAATRDDLADVDSCTISDRNYLSLPMTPLVSNQLVPVHHVAMSLSRFVKVEYTAHTSSTPYPKMTL